MNNPPHYRMNKPGDNGKSNPWFAKRRYVDEARVDGCSIKIYDKYANRINKPMTGESAYVYWKDSNVIFEHYVLGKLVRRFKSKKYNYIAYVFLLEGEVADNDETDLSDYIENEENTENTEKDDKELDQGIISQIARDQQEFDNKIEENRRSRNKIKSSIDDVLGNDQDQILSIENLKEAETKEQFDTILEAMRAQGEKEFNEEIEKQVQARLDEEVAKKLNEILGGDNENNAEDDNVSSDNNDSDNIWDNRNDAGDNRRRVREDNKEELDDDNIIIKNHDGSPEERTRVVIELREHLKNQDIDALKNRLIWDYSTHTYQQRF